MSQSRVEAGAKAGAGEAEGGGSHGHPDERSIDRVHPQGGGPAPQAGRGRSGRATSLRIMTLKTVNLKLVLIPRGKFLMGSPEGLGDSDPNEHPQHEVTITRPFYLGQTEVTQGQYESVMGVNPSYFSRVGRGAKRVAGSETKAHPVEQVGYADALEFCHRLAQREGLPEGSIQLPTEAQWEYAARANSATPPVLGEALDALAWYQGNAEGRTHPVAQKGANAFRLFDMAGNVREWCRDWYGDAYPDTPQRDPIGPEKPAETALRVLRGGSWVESDRAAAPRIDRAPSPTSRPTTMDSGSPSTPSP